MKNAVCLLATLVLLGCTSAQLAADEALARVSLQDIHRAASSRQAPAAIKALTAQLRKADPGSAFVQRTADSIDAAVDKGDLATVDQVATTGMAFLDVVAPAPVGSGS